MPELRIETEETSAAVIARVWGEVGLGQEEALERELTRIILLRPALVILDLTHLSFIASLGMGALVAFHKGLALHEGRVKLTNPRQMVLEGLRRARLHEFFDIHPSIDAALAAGAAESAVK